VLGAAIALHAGGCDEGAIGGHVARAQFADARTVDLADAACEGDVEKIVRLIGKGANPNVIGQFGETPLHWAVDCENLEGIEALLLVKADPNYKPPISENPSGLAKPRPRDIRWRGSPTYLAVTKRNARPLELLLKYGGDPNTYEGDRPINTALKRALNEGMMGHGWDKYYALLNAGADINQAVAPDLTIAAWSVMYGEYDKAVELLERGYSYDLVDLASRIAPERDLPDRAAARTRLIELLKARGVRFPVAPARERNVGRVALSEEGTMTVEWWRGPPDDVLAEIATQTIRPGEPGYDDILRRVKDLKPGQDRGIPR
jgi:hypothetical protein